MPDILACRKYGLVVCMHPRREELWQLERDRQVYSHLERRHHGVFTYDEHLGNTRTRSDKVFNTGCIIADSLCVSGAVPLGGVEVRTRKCPHVAHY